MSRARTASVVPIVCGALLALAVALPAVMRDRGGSDSAAAREGGRARTETSGLYGPKAVGSAAPGSVNDSRPSLQMDSALALADAAERGAALHEALPEFLSLHPLIARQWLREHVPVLAADTRIALLRELAGIDPRLAMELAGEAGGADRDEAIREVQIAWAATDPVASSQSFLTSRAALDTNPAADDGGAAELSRVWSNQDPAAAFEFAATLPSSGARYEALAAVVESWAVSDPSAAARAVANLPPADSRLPLVDRVAAGWASSDRKSALAWAGTLPDAQERLAATATVLGSARR